MLPHLHAHDVTLICASHAPLDKLQAYKQRMGWKFPYVSTFGSDYGASFNEDQQREVAAAVLGEFERPGHDRDGRLVRHRPAWLRHHRGARA
jgi:predicted dithiol-disulfide oxidoreductase (DUF899 family)